MIKTEDGYPIKSGDLVWCPGYSRVYKAKALMTNGAKMFKVRHAAALDRVKSKLKTEEVSAALHRKWARECEAKAKKLRAKLRKMK